MRPTSRELQKLAAETGFEGEIVPELLFSQEPEIAERLAAHPMLRWKAQNAAQHHRRKRR